MTTSINQAGHRKFFKDPARETFQMMGSRFPVEHFNEVIEKLCNSPHGSLCFVMDADCSACNYEPVIEFAGLFPNTRCFILLNGDETYKESVVQQYQLDVPVFLYDMAFLEEKLMVRAVPWAFVINSCGQIVSGGTFNEIFKLKMIATPLIRTFYPEAWPITNQGR